MRALTFQGRQTVGYEAVADPTIVAAHDAIVRVALAGICGSDLHVYHGRETGLDAGTILGHEFVGEVVAAGSGVRGVRVGERVASPFTTSCGGCSPCTRGLSARCTAGQLFGWVENGVGLQGAQAEFVRVPLADSTLLRLPDEISLAQGLLLGDALATGYYCALRAEVAPEGVHVVLGCGPVGLVAVAAARRLGAGRLFAIDRVSERLAFAAHCGATPIDLATDDAVAIVRAASDGLGADSVMEAVGSAAATRLAWELLRPGGTISSVGVHHAPAIAFTPTEAYDKNVTYRSGRCPVRSLMPELLAWLRDDAPDLTAVLTHRLPLSQGPEAYRTFDAKASGCIKVALLPAEMEASR